MNKHIMRRANNRLRSDVHVTVMALAVLFLAACGRKAAEKGQSLPYVKTETVGEAADGSRLSYPGKTRSVREANVAFRMSGPIARVLVDEGDKVRRGQLLAEMDERDYRVQIAAAEAEYAQIKADAERVIALYKEGNTTASAYDRARYGLQQITEKVTNCRNQLADTKIRAPFDGYVQARLHNEGETVSAGMPVVSLFERGGGATEVEIFLPASDFARRADILAAECTFDVAEGTVFPLTVSSVSGEANASGLYGVRLRFGGHSDTVQITPGMTTLVRVTYRSADTGRDVSVPLSAVLHEGDRSYVYTFDSHSSTVRKRPVTVTEPDLSGRVRVTDGLAAGQTIVTAGIHHLTNGQRVQPLPHATEANVGRLL